MAFKQFWPVCAQAKGRMKMSRYHHAASIKKGWQRELPPTPLKKQNIYYSIILLSSPAIFRWWKAVMRRRRDQCSFHQTAC